MNIFVRASLVAATLFFFPGLAEAKPKSDPALATHVKHLERLEKKLVGLAEAMPKDKFDWRPAEGVRSVGEAYLHAAGTLYFLGKMLGQKPPIDPKSLKTIKGKAATIAALKAAIAHAKKFLNNLPPEALDKKVDFFGRPATGHDVVLVILIHTSEHLGQGIAYARMNGVTPPWSKKK